MGSGRRPAWRHLILWSLILGAWSRTPGMAAAPADLPARVQALVRQLNAPDLSVRQTAERDLTELGPEVLPLLPPLTPQIPAEVRERLTRIRGALERGALEQRLRTSRVTLNGDLTVPDALDRIQQQTGNRLSGHQGRPGTVTLDLTDVPFWQALDDVLDQAQLDINPFAGQAQTLVLVSKPPSEQPRRKLAVYSGNFRFEIVRIESRRDLRAPELSTLRITLGIAWEPRLAPISLRQPISALQAVDAGGSDLILRDHGGVLNASVESGITASEIALPLRLPPRSVPQISRLSGTIEVLVPGGRERFEFPDLTRPAEQRKAAACVTLERWRKNLDVYEARLRVRFDDPGSALDSHRGWIYRNEAYLLDANQKRVENVGLQLLQQGAGELQVAYLFDLTNGGEGYRFVYETPALIERMSVPYEFRDIVLP